jgi:anti-sigma regulatory factor (Ser/Thr protein kinase)
VFDSSLPSGPRAAGEARDFVRASLSTTLNASKLADCELMTSDLVTNAHRHAQLAEGAAMGLEIDVQIDR